MLQMRQYSGLCPRLTPGFVATRLQPDPPLPLHKGAGASVRPTWQMRCCPSTSETCASTTRDACTKLLLRHQDRSLSRAKRRVAVRLRKREEVPVGRLPFRVLLRKLGHWTPPRKIHSQRALPVNELAKDRSRVIRLHAEESQHLLLVLA